VIVLRGNILTLGLVAASISAMSGVLVWLCLDRLLPFVFLLSPFFLILSIPVGLPILYCWRCFGYKSALWAAGFSTLFLHLALPISFASMMALQLIVPAAFIATIADLRLHYAPPNNPPKGKVGGKVDFIPLSVLLSTTALLVAITTIILAAVLNNTPSITLLLDDSIGEMVRILTLMRTIPPQQISQFELLLRFDNHALIIRIFALYSFVIALTNFYIASRLKKDLSPLHRPRDYWPDGAASAPRSQLVLLVGATLLSFLPIDRTWQNCLDIVSMLLLLSFTLTGLAAIHLITRGKVWRPFLLTAVYAGLFLLFTSFVLAFWGIFVSTTPLLQRYKNRLKPPF